MEIINNPLLTLEDDQQVINLEKTPLTFHQIYNCNGQYFTQNCVNPKCGLSLKIWCTDWKACPSCGRANYGRHYGK